MEMRTQDPGTISSALAVRSGSSRHSQRLRVDVEAGSEDVMVQLAWLEEGDRDA